MAGTFECETINVTTLVPTNMTMGKLIVDMKTTATLPGSPATGQMVYNTDLARPQIWNGSEWKILGLRLTFPVWTNSTKPATGSLPNGYAGWNKEEGTLQIWRTDTSEWQPDT